MSGSDDPFGRVGRELAGGDAGGSRRPSGDGEYVAPVPASAPSAPSQHPRKGKAARRWAYRDASGGVLGYVDRFDTADGKEVLPLTLWRVAGELRWTWKAMPASRPLYGLQALAERPATPVLVVEGEKAADAAQERFPEFVVVTWAGGSKAAAKSGWGSLAGREVIVWPDADAPGASAAEAVGALALKAGAASVAQVKLPAGLPAGWDLADPWPPLFGPHAAADVIARARAAKACTTWPRSYEADEAGLWWCPAPTEKDEAPSRVWVCAALNVVAAARDEDGGDWSVVVEFRDPDGRTKREIIGRGELAGDGTEVRRRLMSAGLQMATGAKARERLQAALAGVHSSERARLAASTGWKGGLYVLPHRSVGAAAESVIFRGRPGGTHHGERGSLAAWREQVAAKAVGNGLLAFGLSAAFAGPLLRLMSVAEGGGFHIRGSSSTGKTTVLRAAGSVWGGGGELGFAQSWRNTDNALEAVALAHNDGLLALDELRQLDPSAAGAAAYALAAGVSKGRLRADAELKPRPTWRVMVLSAGEIGLADMIRLSPSRDKAYAGQEMRFIDLPADMGADLGAWEVLHGAETPARFSQDLRAATDAHFGHAGPLFVERLLAHRDKLVAKAEKIAGLFMQEEGLSDDTGQARRVAARFGVVAAAGELATDLDVTGWPAGEAQAAAAVLFRRWGRAFGRNVEREDQEAVDRVRAFIGRYEHSRFRLLKEGLSEADHIAEDEARREAESTGKFREGEARSLDAAGWKGNREGDGLTFYFPPEFWRDDLFAGMDAVRAARALRDAGFLLQQPCDGAKRLTCKVRVTGGQARNLYAVSHRILDA